MRERLLIMHFKRNLSTQLSVWSRNPSKMPLVLKGIRKVGKTTLVKEWGSSKYDDVAYFDLSDSINWKEIFYIENAPDIVIEKLASLRCSRIDSTCTLIVFDNIDTCPFALEYLSKFNSLTTKHSIIGISSYFEFLTQNFMENYFKNISIKTLHPLTFKEYLEHTSQFGKASYSHYVNRDHIKSIKKKFLNILNDKFQNFLVSGGLPEPAKIYHLTKSKSATFQVQQNIINSIESDFLRLTTGVLPKRLHEVWISISRDNYKGNFKFSNIDLNSRRREYQHAIDWLNMVGLIYQVKSDFNNKYFPVDIGLANALSSDAIETKNNIEYIYALGCLCRKFHSVNIIDGIIHVENKSNRIPIQCMSNKRIKKFVGNPKNELLVQLKMSDSQLTSDVLQLPVFFVDEVSKFNRTAIKQLETNYFPKKRAADFY